MGFYYGQSKPPEPEKPPGGCMDVWVISRAVMGILAIPMLVILGVLLAVVALFALFSTSWILGLLGVAALVGAIFAYARWERSRFRSGGF